MIPRPILFFALLPAACLAELPSLEQWRAHVAKTNAEISGPRFPGTTEAMTRAMNEVIERATGELDQIARLDSAKLTLANTAAALDDARWQAQCVANVASLLGEASADPPLRKAGQDAAQRFQEWNIAVDYREDVYRALKQFAARKPKLEGEDARLLAETLRDFHRAGLDLPRAEQREIQERRSELAAALAEFDRNINVAQAPLTFTRAELEGMPADFLNKVKRAENSYDIAANVMWQFNAIQDQAQQESTRRKVYDAHDSLAMATNVPLLNRILDLRNRIALQLGYRSWADFQIELQTAKNAGTAQRYIAELTAGLTPKFDAEADILRKRKAHDTLDPAARLMAWDWRYYERADSEDSPHFRADRARQGMFRVFARIFRLRFDEIEPEQKWAPLVQLFAVSDASTNEPLGLLYLDLFTHEGKMNTGGASELTSGRSLPGGKYQRPVASVLLNFEPPSGKEPALVTREQLEILFHEFGHALHAILTRAKYARFAGTNVPRDFVEAPSQMLQNWVRDPRVLNLVSNDHDVSPWSRARTTNEIKKANTGMFYRRQCAFALADLALHGPHPENEPYDCVAISNKIFTTVFLPIDSSTGFIASFRGMDGYDAGYYGYLWSEAMAADMATVFEKAPDGFLDRNAGMRLRREIYERGGSRDVNESVEKFLGRKMSSASFLEKLGVHLQQL